jgi:hypothetical protein
MKVSSIRDITFAAAFNSREVFENNFLASPCLSAPHHQILARRNFHSAARAYNDAINRSINDLIVFCHQDIFLMHWWGLAGAAASMVVSFATMSGVTIACFRGHKWDYE